MIMAASPVSPANIMPKLAQQTASVPDLPQSLPAASSSAAAAPPRTKPRKTRHVRRRRRGDEEDSEDEMVREAGSGSESDGTGALEDSEGESDAEDVPALAAVPKEETTVASSDAQAPAPATSEPVIPQAHNWSDMVSSELDGGIDASLPVIDFAEMGTKVEGVDAPALANGIPPAEAPIADTDSPAPAASTSAGKGPAPGPQSARQAYLEQLNNDPQFIPRVGAFWGHDDRLLDKGLRSMSPWWRDRQMAIRGRGGVGRGGPDGGFRGRGRGRGGPAMYGGRGEAEGIAQTPVENKSEAIAGPSAAPAAVPAPPPPPPPPAHPVDLPWGHDGFEEMRRAEADRAARGRGRGGLRGRGVVRGGPPGRGGPPVVNGVHRPVPANATAATPQPKAAKPNRPEKPWTKDFAAHLYSDPALQPRDNQGVGIRLKFPGSPNEGVVVRLPTGAPQAERTASPVRVTTPSQRGPKVKLPGLPKAQTTSESISVANGGDFAQTIDGPPMGTPPVVELSVETTTVIVAVPSTSTEPAPPADDPVIDPVAKLERQFEQLAVQQQQASASQPAAKEEAAPAVNGLRATTGPSEGHTDPPAEPFPNNSQQGIPQHIQMPPQAYPQYGYGMVLPPGIAMDENGVCFEVATGRVVLLHQPSPMYQPRPAAPVPAGFVPPHMRSMHNPSPETFAHSPYSDGGQPTPAEGYYPPDQASMAFFAQRRSSIPVSIRSPTDSSPGASNKPRTASPASSSLLRAAVHAAPFQPSRSIVTPQAQAAYIPRPGYFQQYDVSPVGVNGHALPDDPAIVGQDPALAQYTPYYPAEQMYGFTQGEYQYTPYGYEGAMQEGYGPPVDGRHQGPAVYY